MFTNAERRTYHAMMIANAVTPKTISNGTQVIRNRYLTWLPFHPQCLNFRANIGISDTSSQQLSNIMQTTTGSIHEVFSMKSRAPTSNAHQNRALAGVGSPMKPIA